MVSEEQEKAKQCFSEISGARRPRLNVQIFLDADYAGSPGPPYRPHAGWMAHTHVDIIRPL